MAQGQHKPIPKYSNLPAAQAVEFLRIDLSKICDIVRDAIPILQKIRKWVFFSKKFQRVIDSIIAIGSVACPTE